MAVAGAARPALRAPYFFTRVKLNLMKQYPNSYRKEHHSLWLLLAVFFLSVLPGSLAARTDNMGQEATDRALLERRSELLPKLSSAERTRMAQFESRIEEGQRMIRSGEVLMQTQPSALNPNRDIAGERRRGEQMRNQGQTMVREGQQGILGILRDLQQRIDEGTFVSPDAVTYRLSIPLVQLDRNLPATISAVMARTREAGFERIFFDTVFVWEGDAFSSDNALGRTLYERLLEDDGDSLILGRAFDAVLKREEEAAAGARPELVFDNKSPLRSALIATEVFRLADGATYLSFRTLDLATWRQVAATMVKLGSRPRSLEADDLSAELFDAEGIIRRFIHLREPYKFAVLSDFEGENEAVDFMKMRLLQTILSARTPLIFGESVFLRNYYLDDAAGLEWEDVESAFFILQHQADGTLEVQARPHSSEQTVTIGTLALPSTP